MVSPRIVPSVEGPRQGSCVLRASARKVRILTEPKNSLTKQYHKLFELETVMTDIMFESLARDDVVEVVITPESINENKQPMVITERPRIAKEA